MGLAIQHITLIGSDEIGRTLGKTSDKRDVETYVHKIRNEDGTSALVFARPTRHPERIRPLLASLDGASSALIYITHFDAIFGEIIVSIAAAGIKHGHFILAPEEGGWIDPEQVELVASQVGLSEWPIHLSIPKPADLHTDLFQHGELQEMQEHPEGFAIVIEQVLSPPGIGTVAIGRVVQGTVHRQDAIRSVRNEIIGTIRSIQVLDEDVDEAGLGCRVGIAIRNIHPSQINKGGMLVAPEMVKNRQILVSERIAINLDRTEAHPPITKVGSIVHLFCDGQFIEGKIISQQNHNLELALNANLALRKGARGILARLDSAPQRIIGKVASIEKL